LDFVVDFEETADDILPSHKPMWNFKIKFDG